PATNTLFVGAVDWCARVQLKRDTADVPAPGTIWFGAENAGSTLFDPPDQARGWVTAFDAENGLVRWKYRAAYPILGGVTTTAGGLVFTADLGGELYALDIASGRVLWQTTTGQSTGGGLITYLAGGRQLLAVAVGMKSPIWPRGAAQSRVLVFGLR
ncbi:MAG TPA: PQQ-binding-like beta-propeller repeat protein, partial [Gemmatimonadales bacterium]|nr:PQQ-binding-like beta-propeller repeat protein [Gemmatimonadales bacterium]